MVAGCDIADTHLRSLVRVSVPVHHSAYYNPPLTRRMGTVSRLLLNIIVVGPSRVQSIAIDRAPPPEKNGDPATAVNAPVVASTV
jgi:hypothetical protein